MVPTSVGPRPCLKRPTTPCVRRKSAISDTMLCRPAELAVAILSARAAPHRMKETRSPHTTIRETLPGRAIQQARTQIEGVHDSGRLTTRTTTRVGALEQLSGRQLTVPDARAMGGNVDSADDSPIVAWVRLLLSL